MKIRVLTKQRMEEIRKKAGATRKQLEQEIQKLLNLLGVQVLSWAKLDYETKGRGGTGTDGISWKPLASSTLRQKQRRGRTKPGKTGSGKILPGRGPTQIGVDTGLQRASASPGFVGPDGKGGNYFRLEASAVVVGFNRSYSEYFDRHRKLLPSELPKKWEEGLEQIVVNWAEDIIAGEW